MLKSAEKHVEDLKSTVSKAKEHLEKKMGELDEEQRIEIESQEDRKDNSTAPATSQASAPAAAQ